MKIHRSLLANAATSRAALYEGDVFLLPPTPASLAFADDARAVLAAEVGDDVRGAAERMGDEAFFLAVGRVRRVLYLEPRFHDAIRGTLRAVGFEPRDFAFDPARLRVIAHRGHENPRAAPVYYAHRDTWYGHPQAMITWWVPLDDLAEDETFVFYPDRWSRAVPNDSEIFDYDRWVKDGWGLKIGWQDREAGRTARYPQVTANVDPGQAVGFSCRKGESLLFSGAHFHRTLPQAKGRARCSLDFRVVHLRDAKEGLGAPNVDGRSRGSALVDYVHPTPPER